MAEAREVVRITGVERQTRCDGSRGNEQIHRPSAARLAPCRADGGVDAAVRTSHARVHRQRLERGLRPLQPVLATGAFRTAKVPSNRGDEAVGYYAAKFDGDSRILRS